MSPLPEPRPDGVLVVKISGSWLGKLLGLPFVFFGGWILWQIPSAVIEYARAGALWDLPAQISDFLIVLLFAAIFGTPGLLLVLGRTRVEIDPDRDEVREATHYGVWTRRTTSPLSAFERIQVVWRSRSSGSGSSRRTTSLAQVELVGSGSAGEAPAPVVLGAEPDEETARKLAAHLATRLGFRYHGAPEP